MPDCKEPYHCTDVSLIPDTATRQALHDIATCEDGGNLGQLVAFELELLLSATDIRLCQIAPVEVIEEVHQATKG